jgi:hypothetical protein
MVGQAIHTLRRSAGFAARQPGRSVQRAHSVSCRAQALVRRVRSAAAPASHRRRWSQLGASVRRSGRRHWLAPAREPFGASCQSGSPCAALPATISRACFIHGFRPGMANRSGSQPAEMEARGVRPIGFTPRDGPTIRRQSSRSMAEACSPCQALPASSHTARRSVGARHRLLGRNSPLSEPLELLGSAQVDRRRLCDTVIGHEQRSAVGPFDSLVLERQRTSRYQGPGSSSPRNATSSPRACRRTSFDSPSQPGALGE